MVTLEQGTYIMKKALFLPAVILLSLITATTNALITPPQTNEKITPELIYQGSNTQEIKDILFNSTGTHFIIRGNSQIALWDASDIKTFQELKIQGIADVTWIPHTNKLAVITQDELAIFDLNFNKLVQLPKSRFGSSFKSFGQFNTQPYIVVANQNSFSIVDENGNVLAKHNKSPHRHSVLSPDDQYLVMHSTYRSHDVYTVNKSGIKFLRSVTIDKASGQSSRDNFIIKDGEVWSYDHDGLNRTNFNNGLSTKQLFDPWYNSNYIQLLEADNTFLAYNSAATYKDTLLYVRLDPSQNFSAIEYDSVQLKRFSDFQFVPQARLLVLIHKANFYLYSISSLYSTPKAEAKISKPAPVIAPAPVTASTPKTADKLDIKIKASVTEGIAPLQVSFLLDSSAPEQVAATFSRVNDEEKIYEGIPIEITTTFDEPGKHAAIFAFRSHNGTIVKDSVTIDVREESFEDYKKRVIGR